MSSAQDLLVWRGCLVWVSQLQVELMLGDFAAGHIVVGLAKCRTQPNCPLLHIPVVSLPAPPKSEATDPFFLNQLIMA